LTINIKHINRAREKKMIAITSTHKIISRYKNLIALIRRSVLTFSFAVLIPLPAQTAETETERCLPQKGLFENYQSTKNKAIAINIPLLGASSEAITLADYAGKGLILNFWATWCAPCVREMPQLNRLSAFVRENQIEVLTISEDLNGLKSVPKFYKSYNLYDLPVLVDNKGTLMRSFAAKGIPLTVFVNQHGQEIGRVVGPAEWDTLEVVDYIRHCLSPKKLISGSLTR
jgi:thiol-disulfide isomerase/thioredoxin